MATKIFGDKSGFTAAPPPGKPAPPPPKKGVSSLLWVVALIVVLAVTVVFLQRSGTLAKLLPGTASETNDKESN